MDNFFRMGNMWYFTADEHYGHENIITHCNRPFDSVEAMDEALIKNHNLLLSTKDIGSVSGEFYRSMKNILFDAMESKEWDFSCEGKYIIPDISMDRSKIYELYHMVRVYNYLSNACMNFK